MQQLYRISQTAGAEAEMSTSREEVLEAIHACLEAGNVVVIARRHPIPGTEAGDDGTQTLTCGGLEIDRVGHEIRCHGRSLKVSELEFRLFESLARHLPRARSYREVWDAVWGSPYYGDSSPLRSLVKRARRKIPPATSGAEIETVRGYGFRLVARRSPAAASSSI